MMDHVIDPGDGIATCVDFGSDGLITITLIDRDRDQISQEIVGPFTSRLEICHHNHECRLTDLERRRMMEGEWSVAPHPEGGMVATRTQTQQHLRRGPQTYSFRDEDCQAEEARRLGIEAMTSRDEGPSPLINAASIARVFEQVRERAAYVENQSQAVYQRQAVLLNEILEQGRQRQERQREAGERAEALLLEHLDEGQRRTWVEQEYIGIKTASGLIYKLYKCGAVKRSDNRHYCIQPTENVPDADAVLARKLLLEADEARFLEIANDITYPWSGELEWAPCVNATTESFEDTPLEDDEEPPRRMNDWRYALGNALLPTMTRFVQEMADLIRLNERLRIRSPTRWMMGWENHE